MIIPGAENQVRDLASARVPIESNTWHDVAITCKGNELSVSIDEVKVLEHIDENDPILSGSVTVGTLPDSHVLFDDIEVTAVSP